MQRRVGWRAAGAVAVAVALMAWQAGSTGHAGASPQTTTSALPTLAGLAPSRAAEWLETLSQAFDERAAMDMVQFMDRYWRNAGNAGFNASIDRIASRLGESGFSRRGAQPASTPEWWVEEYGRATGWDYSVGTLSLVGEGGQPDELLLSREQQRVALCINSFSTTSGGVVAPIVDVGRGAADADYEGQEVRGAVVLGDGSVSRLWQAAVVRRGAIGVISTAIESYIRPEASEAALPRDQWNVLQWGSVPYDEARKGFGFKATPRAAAQIRARLRSRSARVRVDVQSSFAQQPIRTLVAEIPGSVIPAERVVLVAHVQEPGANDNASGCATLVELARAMAAGIRAGRLPAPARTITVLWGDEIRASRQWMTDHPAEAKQVRYMFSLDMTGEDITNTGGTFLIEKAPDPTAVWDRPSDPHTEWGRGDVKAETLKGTLLNDLLLAICERRAAKTGWVVRTNPYEGGSDHSVFLAAGVPSALAWHFVDRFYHSSLDRPDKTSPAEMTHVGVSVAAAALFLASANDRDASDTLTLLERAAGNRLALERRQGAALVAAASDKAAAESREAAVMAAWVKWYAEAMRSVSALPVTPPSATLQSRIVAAVARLGSL